MNDTSCVPWDKRIQLCILINKIMIKHIKRYINIKQRKGYPLSKEGKNTLHKYDKRQRLYVR